MQHPVYLVQHNHFDPIWRRCWDRPFDYKGKRYRSYAELEEYFFNVWLENAKKGATVSEGQAVVFRKYLERNPDRIAEVQELVDEGIIELTAAGETVPDTNMPTGETLLRNLVLGQLWFEEAFGIIPTVGWLEDAFGQSAQIPQIYRGCGCKSVQKLSYKRVPGNYWKGLDGSVIFTAEPPHTVYTGGGIKIAPCPDCNGVGCDKCPYPGLSDTSHVSDGELENALRESFPGNPFTLILVGGEEAVPNPRLPEIVEKARAETGVEIQYGGFTLTEKYYADLIARIDDPTLEVSDQVEANPVSTGCYVTRIKIKQQFRLTENNLNSAERWATVAHLLGAEYPSETITDAWRTLLFNAFHDAITSTHINQAYYELMNMMHEANHSALAVMHDSLETIEQCIRCEAGSSYLAVFNPESWARTDPVIIELEHADGIPHIETLDGSEVRILDAHMQGDVATIAIAPPEVPALGYTTMRINKDGRPLDRGEISSSPGAIENEFYKITCGEHGITAVYDKRLNCNTLEAGAYLINELVLEEDIGHPWGTMQVPSFEERLGRYSTGVQVRKSSGCQEITIFGQYKGCDAKVKKLTWKQIVTLYSGCNQIHCETHVDWDTSQRRIRIAFPTTAPTSDADYSIPYGALKRSPYPSDMSGEPSTNGDWPAINWVDVHHGSADFGVALINTGTPSHKVIDGVIFVSVLRSPTDSWCLNEPWFYDCPDFDEARDFGQHEFTYSIMSHRGNYAKGGVERAAREVNSPMAVRLFMDEGGGGELPESHSFLNIDCDDSIIVTALKKAENEDSIIVRVAETAGHTAEIRALSVEEAEGALSDVNFLEKDDKPVKLPLEVGPFKIKTFKI